MRAFFSKLIAAALWAVLIALVAYEGYQHYHDLPCQNPIEYRIGTIDSGFNVSTTTFMADIAKAGALWSQAAGRTLFEYNPSGDVAISLIYDDRQKITDQEQALTSNIDATTQVAQSVKDQFDSLKNSYNDAYAQYHTDLSAYTQSLSNYNSEVNYWNAKGGAPADEYQKLQAEKAALSSQRDNLQNEQANINSLAGQINALIDKYNLLVSHINDNVSAINNDGLAGTQIEEGVYISDASGKCINIYQFDNQTTFLRVLAHERGHSLGLPHNSGTSSSMNPGNQGSTLALSQDDVAALKTLCKL